MNYNLNWIYFWIDFLEVEILNIQKTNFAFKYNFTFNLDLDNSSQWFIKLEEGFTLSYRRAQFLNYESALIFSISINDVPYDIFYFKKWKINKAKIETTDKVWFYSTCFILEQNWNLPFRIVDFYSKYFTSSFTWLSRLDICLDVTDNIQDLMNWLFSWIDFFSQIWKDEKNPFFSQTYYLKNPLSSKNRNYIFRIYDKILDSFKKWKSFLFSHYEEYDEVRRIEIEIRRDSAKKLLYEVEELLTNRDYCLESIFKWYLMKKNCNVEFLEKVEIFQKLWALQKLNDEKRNIDLWVYYWKNKHIPKHYIAVWNWYFKKLHNVVGFEWIFQNLYKLQVDPVTGHNTLNETWFYYQLFEENLNFALKYNLNYWFIKKIFSNYEKKVLKNKK